MLPRSTRIRRIWPWLLFGLLLVGLVLLCSKRDVPTEELHFAPSDELVHLQLLEGQKEYIDKRGVHVVVGHYVGNSIDTVQMPNITKDIINQNLFDPRPYEGRNGEPVHIPAKDFQLMQQLFQINRYNLLASDRIPLNRTLPDVRKKKCISRYANLGDLPSTSVIVVFHNEAWSTLLRTVHSVINRSPKHLLKEIILVDDDSDRDFLKKPLDKYVMGFTVPTRVLRTRERVGLVNARLMGANEAKGQVLTFLDAHCECTTGWLEPLLEAISKNRTRVVSPVIDIINDDTFSYTRSFELHWGAFNWDLHFRWLMLNGALLRERRENSVDPFKTPAMAGGLFSMDREYFYELGSYDKQMRIWGGENLEMSFRVWQCGGSVEIAPCSHVGHIFRKSSPYTFPGGVDEILYGNLARVALVWMDDWGKFYFKFNQHAERFRDKQQIRSRLALRKRLQCKSFEWYLDNVWQDHFFPKDDRFFGQIVHSSSNKCLMRPLSKGVYSQPSGLVAIQDCISPPNLGQMFIMRKDGVIMTDESVCLDAPEKDTRHNKPKVKLMACSGYASQKWEYDENDSVIRHVPSGMCLEFPSDDASPVVAACTNNDKQNWELRSVAWK
ncbi:polypeptide N-acetylgalactosaminyltransferase 3-like [Phymastichus coffea]|uniref:polypeptide N-acetylgalactosaminyltransferase 3-like n=1 Tax=Phymastichus coffea TaxID=108790 RepID=UPI00273C056B|nr:polypeptide N-acetylgalactosaminyltransferase 3-like [Phymastichus coffea]XP_058791670.1 polypeptide N-acetylgalactosaminyltransferase 3-like [Phymastichus coffea]XP_058791671.1 polypeptide N-acetylgalactosaminyltransferase 3-like [Phymastichus coffea]XP_058791672.1 polypeptide N-acetylgalactosaminyltransferase 3-like [Phymastichus coffea]XP_058791673.1 polypeptide N-acetylgalactosaminyltransferase 3-like [Phymastichus coffea]